MKINIKSILKEILGMDIEKEMNFMMSHSKNYHGVTESVKGKPIVKASKKNIPSQTFIKKSSEAKEVLPREYHHMANVSVKGTGFSWQSETQNEIFYLQGKMMEHFEDNVPYYGDFSKKLPKYRDLNMPQLRGYFTWRSFVRFGLLEKTCRPYFLIYIYELINFIGFKTPAEGFKKLLDLLKNYPIENVAIQKWTEQIAVDYGIYYGIPLEALKEVNNLTNFKYALILEKVQESMSGNFADFIREINNYSTYKILKSKFYNGYPREYENTLKTVCNYLEIYFIKNEKTSLFEKFFGKIKIDHWKPFENTVFYEREIEKRVYVVNQFEKYECTQNIWWRFHYSEKEVNKELIGEVLKTTEFYLRRVFGNKAQFKVNSSSQEMNEEIQRVVENQWRKNPQGALKTISKKKPIEINSDKFEEIRKKAKMTQQKLIIEEIPEIIKENPRIKSMPVENLRGMLGFWNHLEDFEKRVMGCILKQDENKIMEIGKEQNKMVSVLYEGINEKAFDYIEDNLIETEEKPIYIYEDYMSELKEIMNVKNS